MTNNGYTRLLVTAAKLCRKQKRYFKRHNIYIKDTKGKMVQVTDIASRTGHFILFLNGLSTESVGVQPSFKGFWEKEQ